MLRSLLLFLLVAASCFSQTDGLAGKWSYSMDTPAGEMEVVFDLKVEGSVVKGTAGIGERTFPIQNGTFTDGVFKGSVKRDRPQGGTMTYVFNAKLEGASLKGTTEADMDGEKVTQNWEAKKK